MVHRPELLILDEPTSGVDPIARDSLWQLMIDLDRKDLVTIFISTHFMNEAGRVLVTDAPAELVRQRGVHAGPSRQCRVAGGTGPAQPFQSEPGAVLVRRAELQLLSGNSTPRESMPELVQTLMLAAPTTHFVTAAQAILYRGAGMAVVWPPFLALAAIGAVFSGIALNRFRRAISAMT